MEKKINIAELLKDCPKGMELYSPIFGEVYLDKIRPHLAIVVTTDKEQSDFKVEFLYDGRYGMNGECMLFPSKGKTTWDGFVPPVQFKDGDIITTLVKKDYLFYSIYKNREDKKIITYIDYCQNSDRIFNYNAVLCFANEITEQRLSTEEEKQKLFDAIKDNGYKWNPKTKTLEKLIKPKFKVGDRIKYINGKNKDGVKEGIILSITDDTYDVAVTNDMGIFIPIADQDNWELVIEPIFKIGDKIRDTRNDSKGVIKKLTDEGYECHFEYGNFLVFFKDQDQYELVPNKFDITTLKPFESRVLVRHNKYNKWCGSFFSHIDEDFHSHCYKFVTIAGKSYPYCIPYIGNEHLLNTTNDCNEFYKTWE